MSSPEQKTDPPAWRSRAAETWRSVLSWMSWSQRKQRREARLQELIQRAVERVPPPVVLPQALPAHLQYPPPTLLPAPQLWELEALVNSQLMQALQPLAQAMERQDQMREQRTADLLAQLRVVEGMLVDLLKDQPGPLTQMQRDLGLPTSTTRP